MLTTAIASLAAGAVGAFEWRRLARSTPDMRVENALRRARHLIGAVPVAIALLGAQVAVFAWPEITWSAPVWLEAHHVELLLGAVAATISVIFGFASYGALATRHPQRAAAVGSTILIVGIVVAVEWEFTAPIAQQLYHRTKEGVILQSSSASCAAASAANLAGTYGVVRTEAQMAELLGSTRFGTSPAQVVHGMERLGISCWKTRRADMDPYALRAPAVLFLPPDPGGGAAHAVLLAGVVDQQILVVDDPLLGRQQMSRRELSARWKGHAVECAPAPAARARQGDISGSGG
jgi:predicted double-glycine peptidase